MKKTLPLLALLATLCIQSASAWGNLGHSAIAALAERHLTPRAKANIERYTDGHSMVYYASWMDYNRQLDPYTETHYWHVDYWYDNMRKDEAGNPLPPKGTSEIVRIVGEMEDFRSLSDSLVSVNITYLAHLVGDTHCPAHVEFPLSKQKIFFKPWNRHMAFHKVWDGAIVDAKHPGTAPYEYAELLDRLSAGEVAAIQSGDAMEWYRQSQAATVKAHEMLSKDRVVDYSYINAAVEIADSQIRNAGLRLAKLLNAIFDK